MFKRLLLITILAVAAVLGSFATQTPTAAEASQGCNFFRGFFPEIPLPNWATIVQQFDAGDTIMVTGKPTASEPPVVSGGAPSLAASGSHSLAINGVVVASGSLTTILSYTFPSVGVYTITHSLSGFGTVSIWWSCEKSAPGCDVTVTLPSTAVVGTITDNAAVFSDPDAAMMTDIVLTTGKTFWMDGLDASGVYRSTLISCEWVWVEAAKTGPNFDDVWQGTPLPGHTID